MKRPVWKWLNRVLSEPSLNSDEDLAFSIALVFQMTGVRVKELKNE